MNERPRAKSSTVGSRRGSGRTGKAPFGLVCACVLALGALLGSGASAALAAGTCPNETLRGESNPNPFSGEAFSLGLPECRAYEMVSPRVKAGVNISLAPSPWVSEDGDTIAYYAGGAFAGAESNRGPASVYLARRTVSGWQTEPLILPTRIAPKTPSAPAVAISTDFSKALFFASKVGGTSSGDTTTAFRLFIREADGSFVQASPDLRSGPGSVSPLYMGGAPDLSSVVLLGSEEGWDDEVPTPAGQRGLYVVTGTESGSPQVHRVDVDNGDPPAPLSPTGLDGAYTSSSDDFHFVSDDGSTVFISAGGNGAGTTHGSLYVRHLAGDGTGTTTTVAPSGSTLLAGSADGSRAIFTSAQQLVPGDTDASLDLYEYDAKNPPGEQLVRLSGGDPAGAGFVGILRSSDDATHAYFVATGVLTSTPNQGGQTAQAGADNLYLSERIRADDGTVHTRTAFVDLLCSGTDASGTVADPGCGASDSDLWGATGKMVQASSPGGRYLTFASFGQLTPDDTDAAQDVYRYDAETGEMTRVSRAVDGFATDGNGTANATIGAPAFRTNVGMGSNVYSQRARSLSDDGSEVAFETTEALAPDDDNEALDAYLWHSDPAAPGGGTVALITSGHDTTPVNALNSPTILDPSGGNVFFATSEPLVTQDTDNGLRDVYDARVDGGFPAVRPVVPCNPVADASGCQGPPAAVPSSGRPGSTSGASGGNAPPLAAIVAPRRKRVTGARTKLKIEVPASGRITISGPGIRQAKKVARAAGAYRLRVALRPKARRSLHHGRQVSVPATITFRSDSGSTLTKGVSLKFKSGAQKRKQHAKKHKGHASNKGRS